jgi:hypothetical protein
LTSALTNSGIEPFAAVEIISAKRDRDQTKHFHQNRKNVSAFYKRDENGKLVTEDGTDNYKFENLIMEFSELKNPYGSYRIKTYNSPATQIGSFENEEQYNEFKLQLEGDVEIEFCSVSRFVDGEIKVEVLIDNGPQIDSSGFTHEDNFL